ncbi:MAG: signal recognition particle-docking protein FtsY [Pseudomonadota bacterium]
MELELLFYIVAGVLSLGGAGYFFFRRPSQGLPSPQSPPPLPKEDESDLIDDGATVEIPPPPPKAMEATEDVEPPTPPTPDRSEYKTLEDALSKTRAGFWGKLTNVFSGKQSISKNEIDDLEEALYTSDLGPKTVDHLIGKVSEGMSAPDYNIDSLHDSLRSELNSIFLDIDSPQLQVSPEKKPTVWMVVGVNGAGKTTTIGKLASQQVNQGKKVLIAAGDTFRAAADEQLKVWATRAEVEIFSPEGIKDPSAIAFDAVQKGASKDFDLIIIDTAGRLHTQKNLMEELKKMKRVMDKALPGTPHETLLVLDANSGQNALMQTEQFHQALDVTGVILTKMDGSAKGGVAVGIACEHKLPIKMIGVGEKIEDLRPFDSKAFVDSIL